MTEPTCAVLYNPAPKKYQFSPKKGRTEKEPRNRKKKKGKKGKERKRKS
jgi:hypothetical protein